MGKLPPNASELVRSDPLNAQKMYIYNKVFICSRIQYMTTQT